MLNLIEYMLERQAATDRRRSGQPPPWSKDPVIATTRLCSVIRDDDRTSLEARDYILGLPPGDAQLRAALAFRLLNRVSSFRVLFESGARGAAIRPVLDAIQGPVFNNRAYRIMVPGGWCNHAGVARYMSNLWFDAEFIHQRTARATVARIRQVGPGFFLGYQIMQDLRWLYGPYPDEGEWAYLGPGAMRGLARLAGTYVAKSSADRRRLAKGMKDTNLPSDIKARLLPILAEARERVGPAINMFEIEHNLCEWDKYCRVATGETKGTPFKPKPNPLAPAPEADSEATRVTGSATRSRDGRRGPSPRYLDP